MQIQNWRDTGTMDRILVGCGVHKVPNSQSKFNYARDDFGQKRNSMQTLGSQSHTNICRTLYSERLGIASNEGKQIKTAECFDSRQWMNSSGN